MSSELFMFENSFFSDPFSPFTDSHHHDPCVLQEVQEQDILYFQENRDQTNTLDYTANGLLSSSPPSAQLENISISQFRNAEYSALGMKTEECLVNLDFSGCESTFMPLSYDSAHHVAMKFVQRSNSSNCFDSKQSFPYQPQFDSIFEPQNFQNQILSSSENSFSSGSHMRRVCSAGDLHKVKTNTQTKNVLSSSPLSSDKSLIEEANFKVVKYSAEERKQKIDRYRAKRTQRNFNKTIKYACRKTLADNRPRVRGRFARNDETGENIPNKASMFHRYEDEEDHLYIHGFFDEDEEDSARRGSLFNSFGSIQYPNYSY